MAQAPSLGSRGSACRHLRCAHRGSEYTGGRSPRSAEECHVSCDASLDKNWPYIGPVDAKRDVDKSELQSLAEFEGQNKTDPARRLLKPSL